MRSDTIASRFAERVRQAPRATAFVCGGETLSYAELDAASNRFARYLRVRGAVPESVVALHLEHGAQALVAILGVVKTGAAYVALAPSDPPARTCAVLADSGAAILVTGSRELGARAFAGSIVRLAADGSAIEREPAAPLPALAGPGNLFQIVYTSGSTGRPKGVLVPMRAILNRLDGMHARYPFRDGDVALLHRPFSIIGSSWDCFGPLLSGVPTIVVPNFDPGSPAVWRELCGRGVSHLAAAPSMWELILDQAERRPGEWRTLRLAIIGGQTITIGFARRWKAAFPASVLLNVYAATECVYPTSHDVTAAGHEAERVPAGVPFPNVHVQVVGEGLERVPNGSLGEVCVGGACLARGYLNDQALTADRFVPDPDGAPGAVRFRTGDVGYRTPDGVLHVVGRRDRQVKIHGFRVDLGEVEAAVRRWARVAAAAVVALSDGRGDTRLVAYLAAADGTELTVRDLRGFLEPIVPAHMVPSAVVTLSALPLTRSGKVDFQRLPPPAELASAPEIPDGAPAVAAWLARTIQDVLGTAAVRPQDNFFDLGGDSLAAMRVAARIREVLHVEVDASAILDAETVASVAERLAAGDGTSVLACGTAGRS